MERVGPIGAGWATTAAPCSAAPLPSERTVATTAPATASDRNALPSSQPIGCVLTARDSQVPVGSGDWASEGAGAGDTFMTDSLQGSHVLVYVN